MLLFKRTISLLFTFTTLLPSLCCGMENELLSVQPSTDIAAIYNIKNTYRVVSEKYKHLSLIHGAVGWETGFIRRLYDFGDINPSLKKVKEQTKITKYASGADNTVSLVHAFFYRIPGSTGSTDFATTTQLVKKNKLQEKIFETPLELKQEVVRKKKWELVQEKRLQKSPLIFTKNPEIKNISRLDTNNIDANEKHIMETVAKILRNCTIARTQLTLLKNILSSLHEALPNLETRDQILALRSLSDCDKAILQQAVAAVEEYTKKPTKENIKEEAQLIRKKVKTIIKKTLMENQSSVTLLFSSLKHCQAEIRALLNQIACKSLRHNEKEDIAAVILGSLTQSDPNSKNMLYLPYTTEMIFLSFLYKKFGQHKTKIKFFYETLNTLLGSKFLVNKEFPENWDSDCYQAIKPQDAKLAIEKLFKENALDENYEDLVFYATQLANYPIPNGYATTKYDIKKTSTLFPDCMDNAVHNFVRLLAFNNETQRLDVSTLTKRGFKPHPTLQEFLKKYPSAKLDASANAHYEWIKVISNIPYSLYRQTVHKNNVVRADGIKTYGFLLCPHEITSNNALSSKNILTTTTTGFEVKANIRNLIIILNHLLGLDLFEKKELWQEVTRNNFIAEYFEKFYKKLGCKESFLATTKAETEQSDEIGIFDELDCKKTIYATFLFDTFLCQFMVDPGHGEMYLQGSAENVSIHTKTINFKNPPSLSLLVTHLLSLQNMPSLTYLDSEALYCNLFALPVDNTSLQITNIFEIFGERELPHVGKFKKFLLSIAQYQPDSNLKTFYKLYTIGYLLEKKEEITNSEALEAIGESVNNTHPAVLGLVLQMLTNYIKDNHIPAYALAIQAGSNALSNPDHNVCSMGHNLLLTLFKKKNYLPAGIALAQSSINLFMNESLNFTEKQILEAIDNYVKQLTEKKEAAIYEALLHAAINAINSTEEQKNQKKYRAALIICHFLLTEKYNPAYEKIAEIAANATDSDDYEICTDGINLFASFFEEKYLPTYSIVAKKYLKIVHYLKEEHEKEFGSRQPAILKKLLDLASQTAYSPGFDILFEEANTAISQNNIETHISALLIFMRLIELKHTSSYDKILLHAYDALCSQNTELLRGGLMLLNSLLKDKYEPTLQIAQKIIEHNEKSDNTDVQNIMAELKKIIEMYTKK